MCTGALAAPSRSGGPGEIVEAVPPLPERALRGGCETVGDRLLLVPRRMAPICVPIVCKLVRRYSLGPFPSLPYLHVAHIPTGVLL